MKRVAIILLLLLSAFTASADKIKVRLFSNSNIEAINVSFDLGLYDLYANDTLLLEPSLGEGMSVELLPTATGVKISVNGYEYGIYKQACIMATDTAKRVLKPDVRDMIMSDFARRIHPVRDRIRDLPCWRRAIGNLWTAERHIPHPGRNITHLGVAQYEKTPCRRLQLLRLRSLPGLPEPLCKARHNAWHYAVVG